MKNTALNLSCEEVLSRFHFDRSPEQASFTEYFPRNTIHKPDGTTKADCRSNVDPQSSGHNQATGDIFRAYGFPGLVGSTLSSVTQLASTVEATTQLFRSMLSEGETKKAPAAA